MGKGQSRGIQRQPGPGEGRGKFWESLTTSLEVVYIKSVHVCSQIPSLPLIPHQGQGT